MAPSKLASLINAAPRMLSLPPVTSMQLPAALASSLGSCIPANASSLHLATALSQPQVGHRAMGLVPPCWRG